MITEASSPVFDIWTGSELRECVVILTTRPIKQDEVKRFSHEQFQIKGFDSAQIREFSMKFLDDEKDVEMFLDYIKKHKLEEIAEIPLLLLMLCLVWKKRDREGLPESRVFLYSDFIQALCDHMAAKDDDGTVNSIESYNADLAQVGELASRALLENSLEFDFDHPPHELLSSRLIRVGVVQIVKIFSTRPKKVVSFLHKSIQEFLAAWFIIHKLIPNAKGNLSCMPGIDSTEKVVAMVEVLKFVSGWSLEGSSAVLQHLESLKKKHSPSEHHISKTPFLEDWPEDDKKLLELNLEFFIETPASAKAVVYPLLLNSVSNVLVVPDTMLHLVADDHVVKSKVLPNYVLFDFRRCPSRKECKCIASIMEDLNAVIVTASGERKASDFVKNLSEFKVLTSLFLKREGDKMYVHFSQVDNIDVDTLNELTLQPLNVPPQSSPDHLQGDEIAPETNCQTWQHCFSLAKKIDIDEMDDEDVGVISKVMPLVGRPQEITIHGSQESSQPQEIERLVEGMNITECLQRLRLHKIILTAQSLAVVTGALHQASNLQELFLSENPLGSSVSLLAENLQHVQQLTTLELSGVSMEEQAFSDLANALCHVPQLKVLAVNRNNLGPSIAVLADNLDSVPLLTHLELSETQMDEKRATALFTCLRSISKLEVLDVSHNPLGSAVTVIAEHLDGAPCLAVLNMTDVKMGAYEVTALASSLKNLPNLWFLSLRVNPLGRGVCALVKHLSKVPKLKHLDLASVQMGNEEINSVSKACERTQSFDITTDYHVSTMGDAVV
ncbi:NACHT, LRR and PYD domains-containing protein 12 [Desmophyllum pertusum]|uniref:NACHT, LRR and PYD domains-containing protein 12 n=1 Tax=Desmophyllum pertusum TaxID=174260 RepID=A0A9W9Z8A1_9CNID|nr:NACHT, LRR and PYD domains-containing protein 12 [Desmophyllum pertusum]